MPYTDDASLFDAWRQYVLQAFPGRPRNMILLYDDVPMIAWGPLVHAIPEIGTAYGPQDVW